MEISIYDFLKAVDESNRANIMALRCAVSILEDFINLSLDGREMMADTLMDLISQKKKKSDVEKRNLKSYNRTKPEFLIRLIPCLP
ncbi:MAG: hypothetical protein WBZ05_08810 [Desulfobacterales bacterium]|jgi:hypothetical protein